MNQRYTDEQLNNMSDEQLAQLANVDLKNKNYSDSDLNSMSDDELAKIAGLNLQPMQQESFLHSLGRAAKNAAGEVAQEGLNLGNIAYNLPYYVGELEKKTGIPGLQNNIYPYHEPYKINYEENSPEAMAIRYGQLGLPLAGPLAKAVSSAETLIPRINTAGKLATNYIKDLMEQSSLKPTIKKYRDFNDLVQKRGYTENAAANSLQEALTGAKSFKDVKANLFKPEKLESFPTTTRLDSLLEEYKNNPSYMNAHKLQSQLGKEAEKSRFNDNSKFSVYSDARNALKDDIKNTFLKNKDFDLADQLQGLSNEFSDKATKGSLVKFLRQGGSVARKGTGINDIKASPGKLMRRFEKLDDQRFAGAVGDNDWNVINDLKDRMWFQDMMKRGGKWSAKKIGIGGLVGLGYEGAKHLF